MNASDSSSVPLLILPTHSIDIHAFPEVPHPTHIILLSLPSLRNGQKLFLDLSVNQDRDSRQNNIEVVLFKKKLLHELTKCGLSRFIDWWVELLIV